jgi:uncharacterized protein
MFMQGRLDIAVVGSGISGLAAAWLLSQRHNVTLFERDERIGGHSNTIDVVDVTRGGDVSCAVDTGFIVYNTASYPNLIALFELLAVPTVPTDMGFAVSLDGGRYEYSGNGLSGLFGQPKNVLRPHHWRMIVDTLRFFREAPSLLEADPVTGITLGAYLAANGYSDAFVSRHILPMAAAIWSTPSADVMQFPAQAFVRFFANHGLLQVSHRPQWRTVVGGSRRYVSRLVDAYKGRIVNDAHVSELTRTQDGVTVTVARERLSFDACVVAAHADQALALLADADDHEQRLLGAFRYASNHAVLHSDPSFMPQRRRLWSSWNYLASGNGAHASLSLTYWMNRLQPLPSARDLFVTLNPQRPMAPGTEFATIDYAHPMFDQAALSAQRNLWSLQGRRRTWFCGSYFGYGFHEDGLQAGLAVAEHIGGVRRPWTVGEESGRIHIGTASKQPRADIAEAAE